ncbi:MAG: efflux RND transporter periplasmic adaptor subunit [candidate division NC10 bacterium]|nr:efflux RND transporter periplasmic adaptor subunit [candidate division NC10 bacterium]
MRRRTVLLGLAALAVAGIAISLLVYHSSSSKVQYKTARVERGDVSSTISATGNLNAVVTVQVGSQISGMIKHLLADFNSPVKKGQLIARIDSETFEAKLAQAKADLESAQAMVGNQRANVARAEAEVSSARAAVEVAKANIAKAQVAVLDAKINLERRVSLLEKGAVSQSEKDTAQASYDSAVAQLEAAKAQEAAAQASLRSAQAQLQVAQAQLKSAEAQVEQKKAALVQAQVDLDHTYIRAPVDGVVVSRNVDVGQTVAASLQAPTLFLIAQDLTKMQVDTNVDEADVGRVRLDQETIFTVDSYPGQVFRGKVVQIRQAPQMIQNVVTYNVVVRVSNLDLKLMPGMTANVKILVARKENALLVPNSAFRVRLESKGGEGERSARTGGLSQKMEGKERTSSIDRQRVWVLQNGLPTERWVRLGISDGQMTEVMEGLKEGEVVIVGSSAGEKARVTPQPSGPPGLRF